MFLRSCANNNHREIDRWMDKWTGRQMDRQMEIPPKNLNHKKKLAKERLLLRVLITMAMMIGCNLFRGHFTLLHVTLNT